MTEDRGAGPPAVVVVGSASRDMDRAAPRGWRLGGGATYGALALARLGVRVGVLLGVDPEAAGAHEISALRAAGAEVRLVRLDEGPVFELLDRPGGRVVRCIARGLPIPPAELSATWADAPAWLFAPVAGEVRDEWAPVPQEAACVALAWQGLLRELVPGEPTVRIAPVPGPLVRRADLVGVSVEDLSPQASRSGLAGLLRPGATLLVTAGESGGWCVRVANGGLAAGSRPTTITRRYRAIPPDLVRDPTGAGDVFLAAFLAGRLARSAADPRRDAADLRLAAAAASLTVEGFGLAGVPTVAAVTARLRRAPVGA